MAPRRPVQLAIRIKVPTCFRSGNVVISPVHPINVDGCNKTLNVGLLSCLLINDRMRRHRIINEVLDFLC